MNASKTALIIDSGCDLPQDLIDLHHIFVARLRVIYPEKVYEDGVDINPLTVYKRFPAEIPKTSTPNMQEVLDVVDTIRKEGYENVIAISISSGLSGTYNAMRLALEETADLKTFAFDTLNISIGSGIFALWAAEQLENGKSFDDVTAGLKRKLRDSKICYYMDTLDYLAKGGRITPAIALVGKVLHLKPIISCNDDGIYYTVGKFRGSVKGISKLLEVTLKNASAYGGRLWVSIMNGGAAEAAEEAKKTLLKSLPNAVVVVEKQITASMAIHTGPGLIGIGLFSLE